MNFADIAAHPSPAGTVEESHFRRNRDRIMVFRRERQADAAGFPQTGGTCIMRTDMKKTIAILALSLAVAGCAGSGPFDGNRCGNTANTIGGALIGGIGGAIAGAQFGAGSGNLAMTALGTAAGAYAGAAAGSSLDRGNCAEAQSAQ